MGLFDFITKSGNNSNPQSDNPQNPQAQQGGYQTQYQQDDRLVQTPFSEVQYPLPNQSVEDQQYNQNDQSQQNIQAFENVADQNQMQNSGQPTDMYDQGYDYNQPMQFPVQQEVQTPAVPEFQYQDTPVQPAAAPEAQPFQEKQEYLQYTPQFDQSQSQPVAAPEFNPVTEQPAPIESEVMPQQSEVVQPEVAPVSEAPAAAQSTQEELPPLPDINPVAQLPVETNVQVDDVAQSMAPETPAATNPIETNESKMNQAENDLVIGTQAPAEEVELVEALPPLGEPKADESQAVLEEVKDTVSEQESQPEAIAAATEVAPEVSEPKADEVVQGGPKDEVDMDTEIFNDIKTAVKEEFEKDQVKPDVNLSVTQAEIPEAEVNAQEVEEVPVVENLAADASVPQIEKESEGSAFKVFKNIGIVGLNVSNSDQSISEKLMELVRLLSSHKTNFVLDSGRGYGENLLNKLMERKEGNIIGAYLKPFYSDYSDEPKTKFNTPNYSTAIFSNQDLKLKYLIKASDVFIMPHTSGLSNMSLLFALLSNSYLYFGQHKPVILLGKEWNDVVSSLKSALKLNDVEAEQFVVCEEPAQVVELLKKLDVEYSGKSRVNVNKVIDMRNESDESEYFVNNI